jgi:hypothetical protein
MGNKVYQVSTLLAGVSIWIRILLGTLMWIRILPFTLGADPDPNFQIKAQNLENVLK